MPSAPAANRAWAVFGVIPSPPALFSPLTITKSGRSLSTSAGSMPCTTERPVEPTTSPMKRILTHRRVTRMAIPKFLEALLTATGPSGYETPAADVWRESARSFSEDVTNDTVGSSVARVRAGEGAPLIGLVGHVDEIGLVVRHITDEGVLRFGSIGGWDPQVLVGQRVTIETATGPVAGVVGRKPIHLLEEEERKQVAKIEQLYIDIGASSRDDAARVVAIGDPAVIAATPIELANGRIASKAMDNRLGAYIVLEAARRVAEEGGAKWSVAAVAAAQEETTFAGARTTAFALDLQACIVVDVTFAVDLPDMDAAKAGDAKLGHGVQISRGANLHPHMVKLLMETAEAENIPYTVAVPGRTSGTDADAIHFARAGVPCGLVSVPLRYMHSPVETVQLADVEHAIELLAATCLRLTPDEDFRR
jgi:putative aminopeptidase FrvX